MNEQPKNLPAQGFRQVAIANHGGGGMLMPQTFGDVVSFSEIMARSQHAIPKHLRDVPGACLAVTMQAMRWEMDPFAVASKSYNVKDIIAYEAQLVAAIVNTRAPLKTRPVYTYSSEGADRRCMVSAVFDDGVERSYETPRLADIKIKNSPLWTSDPDQQLSYYAIRAFARRYCPEVVLGVYTPEEAENLRGPDSALDVTPRASLSERLAAAKDGASASNQTGFSHAHVINEIDGAINGGASQSNDEIQDNVNPNAHHDDSSLHHEAAPAPSDPASTTGGAGDNFPGDAAALPDNWQVEYVGVLRRARQQDSLKKFSAQFWDQYGGREKYAKTDDGKEAAAIFMAFEMGFGDRAAIDAQLREIGVL